MQFTIYGYKRMHEKICFACFENHSINHTSVYLIAVAAQSRYNLGSRNATLFVLANARCLPSDLVTEPFSRKELCELCEKSSGGVKKHSESYIF